MKLHQILFWDSETDSPESFTGTNQTEVFAKAYNHYRELHAGTNDVDSDSPSWTNDEFESDLKAGHHAWIQFSDYHIEIVYMVHEIDGPDELVVETKAGTLTAWPEPDPGAPGIGLSFKARDLEYEIDLCRTEVKENSEYATRDNETPDDVCMYVYSDPYMEDYTHKHVIRREDVFKGFQMEVPRKETA